MDDDTADRNATTTIRPTAQGYGAKDRLGHIDGMRGLAIILVALFHVYSRWPDFYPYGDAYSKIPFIAYGWLGVQLFFMISGFVISMTLERCGSFLEFLKRRWVRLFPAMFVVSALVFVTAKAFPHRPSGLPNLIDLIPGILFVEPGWLSKVTGVQIGVLEGVFWSLFAEVKFYFLFGGAYYLLKPTGARVVLAFLFLLSLFADILGARDASSVGCVLLKQVSISLSLQHFGWFLLGVLVFDYSKRWTVVKLSAFGLAGVVVALFSAHWKLDLVFALSGVLVLLFVLASNFPWIKRALSAKVLLFAGFISYPFYLLHENLAVSMIRVIGTNLRPMPDFLVPIIPISILCGISYAIAKFVEPKFQISLRKLVRV